MKSILPHDLRKSSVIHLSAAHYTHICTYAHMQQINESILDLEHLKFTCGNKVLEWTCSRLISYRVELDGILLHVKLGNSTKVTCAGNLYPLLAN